MEGCVRARTNAIAFKSNQFCGRLAKMLREVSLAIWERTALCLYAYRATTILIAIRCCPQLEEKAAFGVPTEVSALHLTCASAQKVGAGMIAAHPFAKPK
mmetsp:Transcript_25016/g.42511  ORF Transcript_25016/g.42511 Transcript_25016/m.42511 type:complete len:100 (-) Transcript_25016:594-893(-)